MCSIVKVDPKISANIGIFKVSMKRKAVSLKKFYEFDPSRGFFLSNITSLSLSGIYECMFTSLHVFEQKIIINLFVEERFNSSLISDTDGKNLDNQGTFDGDDEYGSTSLGTPNHISTFSMLKTTVLCLILYLIIF